MRPNSEMSVSLGYLVQLLQVQFNLLCKATFYIARKHGFLIPIQMANIIMCRTVSTEPISIPILMQMGTVLNLTPISVPIR